MKQILTSLFLVSLSTLLNAQTNYSPTGNWRWKNGSDTIDFKIKSSLMVADSTTTYPVLIGFARYVKNSLVIQDNINDSATNYNANKFSFILFDDNTQFSSARIDGSIKDVIHNDERYLIFKKINPTTINVTLTSMQGGRRRGTPGYTLLRQFTLTKL